MSSKQTRLPCLIVVEELMRLLLRTLLGLIHWLRVTRLCKSLTIPLLLADHAHLALIVADEITLRNIRKALSSLGRLRLYHVDTQHKTRLRRWHLLTEMRLELVAIGAWLIAHVWGIRPTKAGCRLRTGLLLRLRLLLLGVGAVRLERRGRRRLLIPHISP